MDFDLQLEIINFLSIWRHNNLWCTVHYNFEQFPSCTWLSTMHPTLPYCAWTKSEYLALVFFKIVFCVCVFVS